MLCERKLHKVVIHHALSPYTRYRQTYLEFQESLILIINFLAKLTTILSNFDKEKIRWNDDQ